MLATSHDLDPQTVAKWVKYNNYLARRLTGVGDSDLFVFVFKPGGYCTNYDYRCVLGFKGFMPMSHVVGVCVVPVRFKLKFGICGGSLELAHLQRLLFPRTKGMDSSNLPQPTKT